MTSASRPSAPPAARTFRLPRSAYLVAGFLFVCAAPLALAGGRTHGSDLGPGTQFGITTDTPIGPRLLFLLVPLVAALFVARTRTRVDASGIRVRALLGQRRLPWARLRGLSVSGRSVYAVTADGAVRLPCVRVSDLHAIAAASGGRLPDLPEATPKYAPSTRARRGR